MGCGASTQAQVKEAVVQAKETGKTMYAQAKEKATEVVAQGKYAAIGCKFDPDATASSKRLAALDKGIRSAKSNWESWAKASKPLKFGVASHWARTVEMPPDAKAKLMSLGPVILGAAGAHEKYTKAMLSGYVAQLGGAADAAKEGLKKYAAYEEAEYNLVYEEKMNSKKLTEDKRAELKAASAAALEEAKKALAETMAAVETNMLVPALATPCATLGEYVATVANGDYAAAASAGDETEAEMAAQLEHAESMEFKAAKTGGMSDMMGKAKEKLAEMKVQYKNVSLPADFTEANKTLDAHKKHMFGIANGLRAYRKADTKVLFLPEKWILRDEVSKMENLTSLKQSLDGVTAKLSAIAPLVEEFNAALDTAATALEGIVNEEIKAAKEQALVYEESVYKWSVSKQKSDKLKAKEALSDKEREVLKAEEDSLPALEETSTKHTTTFYELCDAVYVDKPDAASAVTAKALPALEAVVAAHKALHAGVQSAVA